MNHVPATSLETRSRLLDAAGEVFAEEGFRNATVREICERAGANVAAVNYHFQNKEQLYAAVLRHAHGCALEKYPPMRALPSDAAAKDRLRAFVHSFLLRIFDQGRPAWFGKLMAREMVEPTSALDELVEQGIRPQAEQLTAIVRDVLGEGAATAAIQRCVLSIVGQCVFEYHARAVVERLFPSQRHEAADIERLAEHITNFSYAAMTSLNHE